MKKIVLGLDIGVASVGWSIIDKENGDIIDLGSRLFNSADASENETRRESRGARRLNRRKKHRLVRAHELLEKADFQIDNNYIDENPYQLRVKGLSERLTKAEIFVALSHLVKRRGVSYLEDIDEKEIKNDSLKINIDKMKTMHPAEIQLNRLEQYGKVRGIIETEDNSIVNIFTTGAYKKEAETILNTQSQYYPQINQEFIEQYLNILTSKRDYFTGPGNEKSRTDYGVYRTNGEKWDNIFEILIGKCSIYPEEFRAARASYTAQEFNILNDLNNLKIKNDVGKLSTSEKIDIIEKVKSSDKVSMLNLISKYLGCQSEDISGYRIDKKGKPEFHTFEIYRKINKALPNEKFSIEEYDQLAHILTINSESSEIKRKIQEELPNIKEDVIDTLIILKKKGGFSSWHSLSIKVMREDIIPVLYKESKNHTQIVHELGVFNKKADKFKDLKYLPEEEFLTDIYNPIAKRSIRQSIKIVNAVMKEHKDKELDSIAIEMPREYISSDEEKKALNKMQANNEKEKKESFRRAKEEYNFDDSEFHNHKQLALKLRLWYQQDQKCLYSGDTIKIKDLIYNHKDFEIDHIIPESISLDDSLNNKVICYSNENQKKGKNSPFRYFKSKASDWTYNQFKEYVTKLHKDRKISSTKQELLLMEDDINKWEVRQNFISRNLVDTRYASKVVLNSFQDFFVAHDKNVKIKVVRGKFIYQLRKGWGIKKDRDESYGHHAIDATIIAASSNLNVWKRTQNLQKDQISGNIFNKETGEIMELNEISEDNYKEIVNKNPYTNFRNKINDILDEKSSVKIKYSHMVSKKTNRKISTDTIYSTREQNGIDITVGKIKDIYDNKSYNQFKNYYNKDKTKFLMYQHDIKTFEILENIINTYPDVNNPFLAYKDEHGYIRKYSKKGNGAVIKNLKFLNKKLGQSIDITTKNAAALPKNKKIVLLQVNPYRADVYKNTITGEYAVIGIKYKMFTFDKNGYQLRHDEYINFIKEQGITNEHEFCFSLYKNNIIEFGEDSNNLNKYRFLSKVESGKNIIEVKPINKPKAEDARFTPTIKKNITIFNKYNVDILGNMYKVYIEKDPRIIY